MYPSHSFNNPFVVPQPDPWQHAQSHNVSRSSSSRPLPSPPDVTPRHGPYVFAVPGAPATPPGYQQQAFAPQGQYLPAMPQFAYSQLHAQQQQLAAQQYCEQEYQQHLPRLLCPQFVPPRVPHPPPFLTPAFGRPFPYVSAQPYQTAPPNPRVGIPASGSEFIAAVGPVPKVFPLTTTNWKETGKLALEQDNWREFSSKVENQLGMVPGMARFLHSNPDDPNTCPSMQLYPAHHRAWLETNTVVLSFLHNVLTVTERTHIAHCAIAADAWATLRYRHLTRGPAGQSSALKRFANISYASDPKTFAATTTLLMQMNEAIWQCAKPHAGDGALCPQLEAASGDR
ncbi:hypothetical protein B0H17DRAFT_1134631 [Mycena rosella]|uniref:Uncharacterized protein n=1 Tax=Mycena rosella TaxID=1033263 RepID=A0AAD7DEP0_MYCRO|nr:hypothetical protein B0H17DRAFT_1134631 [Mycena rosella]